MNKKEYQTFSQYQDYVFDLVENMRELNEPEFLSKIFEFINKKDPYLVDIVIMLWCVPRIGVCLTKRIYNQYYYDNIKQYNSRIIEIIRHETIKNFCIETLSKTNNVPVHCIDYLWFYMDNISIELIFYNNNSADYIGISIPKNNEEFYEFGLNMEYLLSLGLGQIVYNSDPNKKGSFRNLLKNFVTNAKLVKHLLNCQTGTNYHRQLATISKNPSKYFGPNLTELPTDVLQLLDEN